MKTIDTLIPDIYELFAKGHECSEENLENFGKGVAQLLKDRLAAYKEPRAPTLRMSNIGKPDRQLWYDLNDPEGSEELKAEDKFKFIYGDLIEALVLFLAKEAGHKVENEQGEVIVEGVVGHIDAEIDDVVVDVKSTSDYAFKKFENGTLAEDDPFGYIKQLSGYVTAEQTKPNRGAFLAVNKVTGRLVLFKLPEQSQKTVDVPKRIREVRTLLDKKTPPARCYSDEDHNTAGNKKLGMSCSFCPHKFKCWSDANGGKGLRAFQYSNGITYLTKVQKEPNVPEVT